MRVLYGLDALPRSMPLDDPRLPSITLGPTPLRLNTHPVPPAILAEAASGHAARVAAMTRWLQALAGTWAAGRRRQVSHYMASIADEIARDRADIETRLERYDGLYQPHDYLWSALRPLPRAWIVDVGAPPVFVDIAFWDGANVQAWPASATGFWQDDGLPRSPFRRPEIRASVP